MSSLRGRLSEQAAERVSADAATGKIREDHLWFDLVKV